MIIDYPLADRELIDTAISITDEASNRSVVLSTAFVPEGRYVSLGASNKPEQNVNEANCINDGVLVFRRQSGGEAVFGCAIYRKPRMLLFQSVINVCESPITIESYLLHPQREPDYRKNRKHSEFITSLHLEGYNLSPQQLAEALSNGFTR